ncbi:MAG: TonB-dependent receptor [Nevskiaceae bacterium]|jgi:outer membrane receptor protein involved in Fe transport|nr:TonB-dependent receptor [Nevskiaceae bacterium]
MVHSAHRHVLLVTTSLGSALCAVAAHAQQPAPTGLEEVVVTATRQADTVNRVALSITAETQRNLDQRGIRNLADLQGNVPALNITTVGGPGVANPIIRGIANTPTAATAATTGFYLDDTPLQKRNTGGGVFTLNGTPLPPLFDLERIEVLRGPQGTLYGGSSEGGTIRYITPAPSLTDYSSYARAEVSSVQSGGTNYEAGVAVGGPLIENKLGFRGSIWAKHDAGWVDIIDPLNGSTRFKDANDGSQYLARLSLAWQVSDNLMATLAYFTSHQEVNLTATNFNLSVDGVVTEPTQCYNTATVTSLPFPNRSNPPVVATGDAACNAAQAANPAVYIRRGASYGPYNLKPFQQLGGSIGTGNLNPTATNMNLPTLTLDYNLGRVSVKSITSMIYDGTKGIQLDTSQLSFRNIVGGTYTAPGATPVNVPRGFGFIESYPDFWRENGRFTAKNQRDGFSQEIRFSSEPNATPFSWVGGLFYSNMKGSSDYRGHYELDRIAGLLYGITAQDRYGVPALPDENGDPVIFDTHQQTTHDTEWAIYGEANYWITERLRLTGGLRISRVDFDYYNQEIGPGSGFNTYDTPGAISSGSISNTPVTPKVTVQYQLTDQGMVYATAAKGFRPGGVNNLLSPNICSFAVGQFGLDVFQLPETFQSDSVWSYELGGKFRLFDNRLQVNGDVYRIDWNNPQTQVAMGVGCGVPIVANGGKARSEGLEFESEALLFDSLTANLAVGYNKSESLETVTGLFGPINLNTGAPVTSGYVVSLDGTPLTPIAPKWSVQTGARYDYQFGEEVRAYIRADYRWTSKYVTSFAGTQSYAPDASVGISTDRLNLRLGFELRNFDVNVFATNLLGQKGNITGGGRAGCPIDPSGACPTFTSYNPFFQTSYLPRVIGLQVAYRN